MGHNQFSYLSQAEIAAEFLTVDIDKIPIFIPEVVLKVTSSSPNITFAEASTNSVLSTMP